MDNTWSPHPREAYTVIVNGEPAGLGAREEFENRPGLWNMFWLHSTKVDLLLDWPLPPDTAPYDTIALSVCIQSADFDCDGLQFEGLCARYSPESVIEVLIDRDYHPPIRKFWDQTSSGWESFVRDRLRTFKRLPEQPKRRSNIIQGNFPLRKRKQ